MMIVCHGCGNAYDSEDIILEFRDDTSYVYQGKIENQKVIALCETCFKKIRGIKNE